MAEIKHQIPIQAAPEKVYAAIATQQGLRGWWTADTNADEKVDGKAEFGFDKRGMVFRIPSTSWTPESEWSGVATATTPSGMARFYPGS